MIPFFQGAAGGAPVVSQVFATTLYTGNGSTNTVTSGINVLTPGGLVWGKTRNTVGGGAHNLHDTLRGATNSLATNSTGPESTIVNGLTAFGTTGFTLGSGGNLNSSGDSYVAWSFARAARFFDVVTYTGNGSTLTVNHSLGTTPGMIIVKCRSTFAAWIVYHRSQESNFGTLNATDALNLPFSRYFDAAPTAASFSVANTDGDGDTNGNGRTYVAYLFAHDTASDGIVQCGSYTGNGSATGPTVTLGWNPQFVMIKRSDSTGEWVMFDTARGIVAGNDPTLCANSNAAEDGVLSAGDYLDLTGTGFQLASTSSAVNANTGTYAYLAIRSA
jgi:hypothetical protein